jgi:hypothetical protein
MSAHSTSEKEAYIQSLTSHTVSHSKKLEICKELKPALSGDIGDVVAKHEEMILHYYSDVQDQAQQSFLSAKIVSRIGFAVLIATLTYTLVFDALSRLHWTSLMEMPTGTLTTASIGLVSGVLIEFIAGVNFWLYSRAAKQFGAFHICLERTHRYLVAFKIAEKISINNRDKTLEELVCIMANAPMISGEDINSVSDGLTKVPVGGADSA